MLIDTHGMLTYFGNYYIEESVEFAFNFTKLQHPFKAKDYGAGFKNLTRTMNVLQYKRNDYFADVLEQCKKPSQEAKQLQLRSIFCKVLHELESVLVCELLKLDEEPMKHSWSVAEKFWKNIKDDLKDYNPLNEAQILN